MGAKNITKQDVIDELMRLQNEGHSMRIGEFEHWLKYEISKHFSGWKNARTELGIAQNKQGYFSDKKQAANSRKVVWTDEVIKRELSELISRGLSRTEMRDANGKLFHAIQRRFDSLDDCGGYFGIKMPDKLPPRTPKEVVNKAKRTKRVFNSREDVAIAYKLDLDNGIKRSDITFRKTINKYFESVDLLDEYLGISRKRAEESFEIYPKELIDEKVSEIYDKESEKLNSEVLNRYDKSIVHSIRYHYKTITEYFSQLDIDFYSKPYVPFRWDAENTKRQLLRWIREGKPVNYTSVAYKHSGIIDASRKIYGSYEGLFVACGLNYDDYRTDTKLAAFYGKALENVFEELLKDLGVSCKTQPEINGCHPDFVVGQVWYDAKLSEWTINNPDCETVKKYEPHCDHLVIVFLRGNKETDRMISEKTRLVNIYKFVEKLPYEKQLKYKSLLSEIESNVNSNELGSRSDDKTA